MNRQASEFAATQSSFLHPFTHEAFVLNSSTPFGVCAIIVNMNPINLIPAIFEVIIKTYSIICKKPYETVEVKKAPQRGTSGKVTKELFTFTITNESGPEVEVQKTWVLKSFNRPVLFKFIDSNILILGTVFGGHVKYV